MDSVPQRVEASFTPRTCTWGCMDALAVAETAVMMTMDANAGVEIGQRGSCGTLITADAALPGVKGSTEDNDNNDGDAADGNPEDAAVKLSNTPRLHRNTRSAQPLTCPDST